MSLDACIPELVASGKLDKEQASYVEGVYAKLRKRQRDTFGKQAADATAGFQTIAQVSEAVRQQRRQVLLDVSIKKAALDAVATYRGKRGKFSFGRAIEALFARDDRAPYSSVEDREIRRRQQALSMISGVLDRHSRNVLGQTRDTAGLRDLLRELRGEKTGNKSAAELADAVRQMQDLQLAQFNAAGGNVRPLKNRGVAQVYDAAKVNRVSMEEFRDDMLARLHREAMIDQTTGEAPTPEALEEAVEKAWQDIRTESAGQREEGGFGGLKLANTRQERRFFVFKDTDAWLEIADKYGNANVFDAIHGELNSFAGDIAKMEILGPNPEATVRWIKDVLMNKALLEHGAGSDAVRQAQGSSRRIDAYWGVITGASSRGENNTLRLIGSTLRAHQVTTKLGSAVVTALPTDLATTAITRAFNGIPVVSTGYDYLRFLALPQNRELAARFGFVADIVGGHFSTQARLFGEELSGEVQQRMAEAVMRLSGMKLHTDAARMAFSMEVLAHISNERGKTFAQLDRAFRGMFERYGMDAAAWDSIRSTRTIDAGGAAWIHPDNFDDDRLADKVMEMIYAEQDLAVVTPGVKTRAAIAGFGATGTPQGEIARTLLQFKAFPLTIMMSHGARMMALQGGWSKALYSSSFLLASTMAGWFALEAKAIIKGQDPRPLDVKTVFAAMQQGGGLGIYGDFLFGAQNRFGQGLSSSALGPATQTLDAVSGLLLGTPLLQAQGERVDYDKQLVRLLRSETPGGSLWYARLAYDRLILDQWQAAADPNYFRSWRQMERRAHDFGTQFWWEPGETAPTRAPELIGEPQ